MLPKERLRDRSGAGLRWVVAVSMLFCLSGLIGALSGCSKEEAASSSSVRDQSDSDRADESTKIETKKDDRADKSESKKKDRGSASAERGGEGDDAEVAKADKRKGDSREKDREEKAPKKPKKKKSDKFSRMKR